MPIELLLSFAPCKLWIRHIDDYAFVTIAIFVSDVSWFVLAADELRDVYGHAAYRHSFGVEQMISDTLVINCNILTLGLCR